MYEFLIFLQPEDVEAFLEEIFYGFYIMVGHAFDLLDAGCVLYREVAVYVAECPEHTVINSCQRS